MPTIASWPSVVGPRAREVWAPVATFDLLPTALDAWGLARPAAQQDWALDGRSMMPLFQGADAWPEPRTMAWAYHTWPPTSEYGYAYREGGLLCAY